VSLWSGRNLPAQIDLADSNGSIVWTRSYPAAESFRTAALPAGTYFARASTAGAMSLCQLHQAVACTLPTDAAGFLAATPIIIDDADVDSVDFALDDAVVFQSSFD